MKFKILKSLFVDEFSFFLEISLSWAKISLCLNLFPNPMVRSKDIYILAKSYYNENVKIFIFQYLLIFNTFWMISSQIDFILHQKNFWTILDQIFPHGPRTIESELKNSLFHPVSKMVSYMPVASRMRRIFANFGYGTISFTTSQIRYFRRIVYYINNG